MKHLAILCVSAILLAGVSDARASWLHVDCFQYSDPAFETGIDLDLSDCPQVTGVRAVSADGTPLTLDEYTLHQFAATLGPFYSQPICIGSAFQLRTEGAEHFAKELASCDLF